MIIKKRLQHSNFLVEFAKYLRISTLKNICERLNDTLSLVPSRYVMSRHFTETHRKTSNFYMCLLNFISTCYYCFIQKIIYHLKRNWPRFSLPKFCRISIYVITIVKFSNRSIQNPFNFPQRTSMDFCKVY